MHRLFPVVALLLTLVLFAPTATAQDASPEASPAVGNCVAPEIPPGTPTPMEASPAADMGMAATPEEEPPPPAASPEVPVGEPAPDDVAAEAEAAVENLVNCFNADEHVMAAALHTEAGLLDECGTTNVHDGPMCFDFFGHISNLEVSNVQVYDDGQVSADVTAQVDAFLAGERWFFVVDDDGTYLVDSTPDRPVEIPAGATVIDGEMADYEFILSETSAPAGDIAFDVTNTGEYPHEMVVLQLPEGITVEDVFADESLFAQVQFFGFTYADPGADAFPLVMLDMEPGIYTIVCFVDVPEGIPHVMRGMILEFEVGE